MEVPAGHDGIQQLLLAEQEAQAIIAKARKGKHKKTDNYSYLATRLIFEWSKYYWCSPELANSPSACFRITLVVAKAERLKQAKEEAEREVAAYKIEREAEFKRKMADDSTSSEEHLTKLNADSEQAVVAIKASIASEKEQVIQMLIKQVTKIHWYRMPLLLLLLRR